MENENNLTSHDNTTITKNFLISILLTLMVNFKCETFSLNSLDIKYLR